MSNPVSALAEKTEPKPQSTRVTVTEMLLEIFTHKFLNIKQVHINLDDPAKLYDPRAPHPIYYATNSRLGSVAFYTIRNVGSSTSIKWSFYEIGVLSFNSIIDYILPALTVAGHRLSITRKDRLYSVICHKEGETPDATLEAKNNDFSLACYLAMYKYVSGVTDCILV